MENKTSVQKSVWDGFVQPPGGTKEEIRANAEKIRKEVVALAKIYKEAYG